LDLLGIIERYCLDEREPYWRKVKLLIERGMLSGRMCKALLHQAQKAAQHQKDYPDYLHRVPATAEQLYTAGKPQVRLATVSEDPSLLVGVTFDRPLFIAVAGATGFGKTTFIRILLQAIHEYNKCHPEDPSR
jgi:ATPase subunit of ABC transporter with duplicated ATPase domains